MPTVATRICPNCQATFSATARICPICKLETAKMEAFAAAKQAAQKRGLKTVKIEEYSVPLWRRPSVITVFILLLIIGFGFYKYSGVGKPPAWALLPTTKEDAATQLLTDISTGQDAGYDKAYALIAVHDPDISDEPGKYRQLFHNLNQYLAGEFGADWRSKLTLEQSKDDPNIITAHIAKETLHISLSQQTPADKSPETNPHYGVVAITEFDIHEAGDMQQMSAIKAIWGAEGGPNASRNLNTVLGGASPANESPMDRKLRILPVLHDPRSTTRRAVLQAWPLRKDPVVRARLEQITQDQRYGSDCSQTAQQVLDGTVPDEDLIAAGVPEN